MKKPLETIDYVFRKPCYRPETVTIPKVNKRAIISLWVSADLARDDLCRVLGKSDRIFHDKDTTAEQRTTMQEEIKTAARKSGKAGGLLKRVKKLPLQTSLVVVVMDLED
jgi:hypothetical protein